MKKMLILVFVFSVLCTAVPFAETNGWKLVWSDDFDGQAIDLKKWNLIEGGFGGGNEELQYYSARKENAFISNGYLVLQARREGFQDRRYTSAKLTTQDKGEWLYGRFEFRAKLAKGKGMWPAIWMMPSGFVPYWESPKQSKNKYGEWPGCGEIDILESRGSDPRQVQGTLIYGLPYYFSKRTYEVTNGGDFSQDFHLFSFEWEPGEMRWYVDGNLYAVQKRWFGRSRPTSTNFIYPAPFDVKFFLQLNLAVGGNFDGDPDGTTAFPSQMLVDYVRVYQKKSYTPIDYEITNNIPQLIDWSKKFDTNKKFQVTVRADSFRNDRGQAVFLVSKNRLDDPVKVYKTPITNRSAVGFFEDIPEGYYMIFVYHDENGNGVLDMSPGNPYPEEGSGLAGIIGVLHEPPVYSKAAVPVTEKRTNYAVEIGYNYK